MVIVGLGFWWIHELGSGWCIWGVSKETNSESSGADIVKGGQYHTAMCYESLEKGVVSTRLIVLIRIVSISCLSANLPLRSGVYSVLMDLLVKVLLYKYISIMLRLVTSGEVVEVVKRSTRYAISSSCLQKWACSGSVFTFVGCLQKRWVS